MSRRAIAFAPAVAAAAAFAASGVAAAPPGAIEICTGHGAAWILLPLAGEAPLPPGGRKESGGCAHFLCPRGSGEKGKLGRRA